VKLIILLLLTSFAAARCPEPLWVIYDDRIGGVVSKEGQPLKHVNIQLFSSTQEYRAITDDKGGFLIPAVAVGKYAFAVNGWGRHIWRLGDGIEGQSIVPLFLFSSTRKCLLLIFVAN
jgi:hypothetical protein